MRRLLVLAAILGAALVVLATARDEPAKVQAAAPTGPLVTRPTATRPLADATAARRVKRSSFEPRKANYAATHRRPTAAQVKRWRATPSMPYAKYVTGNFKGTTDEVIQWAAIKWGINPDLLRAVAVVESYWRMSTVGDNGDSFGLFQVRRPYHCTEPSCALFREDAGMNADYYAGILRAYYDGKQTWLNDVASENGKPYRRGDIWASVGAWYSGRWWNDAARGYVAKVKSALASRTWRSSGF